MEFLLFCKSNWNDLIQTEYPGSCLPSWGLPKLLNSLLEAAYAGRPDEFGKKSPKTWPNPFFDNFYYGKQLWKKIAQHFVVAIVISKIWPKKSVTLCIVENSSDLVTPLSRNNKRRSKNMLWYLPWVKYDCRVHNHRLHSSPPPLQKSGKYKFICR
jgi:hypothetical protein